MSTHAASTRQFTYAFAKEKGLIVLPDRDTLTVGVRTGADAMSLIEARRALGRSHAIESLDPPSFDRALTAAFSQ